MSRIYKRKNVYYIDVIANGKRIRRKVGKSKAIAEMHLKDIEVQIAKGETNLAPSPILIDEFFDRYHAYARAHFAPKTVRRYEAIIAHFLKFITKSTHCRRLTDIRKMVIDEYVVSRCNEQMTPNGFPPDGKTKRSQELRKGACATTVNFEVDTLKAIFNLAKSWGFLRDNPAVGITKIKERVTADVRHLSEEECIRLLDEADEDFRNVLIAFLNTGMRKGELQYLEWSDIDFARRAINIRYKPDWNPKSGERSIPMNAVMFGLLTRLCKENIQKSRYVFTNSKGERLGEKLRDRLMTVARRAGIEDLTKIHTLRHTFATILSEKGADVGSLQKVMGHADIQTTMIYVNIGKAHLANVTELIAIGESADNVEARHAPRPKKAHLVKATKRRLRLAPNP